MLGRKVSYEQKKDRTKMQKIQMRFEKSVDKKGDHMSELTRCNFCSLQRIKARAKEKDWKVSVIPDWNNGIDVYMHPNSIKTADIEAADEDKYEQYQEVWFMKLSNHCVC